MGVLEVAVDEVIADPEFEEVFTVSEYYDGPRQGVANFNGSPHFYDCIFSNERDDYLDMYYLTPIPTSVLDDTLEDWAIFRRWELAFHTGQVAKDTFPALPAENGRSKELKIKLDGALKTDSAVCVKRIGRFQSIESSSRIAGVLAQMRVKWSE